MSSLLQAEPGLPAFIDNLIILLALRHQAPLKDDDHDESDEEVEERWSRVATNLQASLRHPQTADERLALRWVEPHKFTAAVCRHRAAYILWKAKKYASECSKGSKKSSNSQPSGFDVTKHSLSEELKAIYDHARKNLPTINMEDDVPDGPVEVIDIHCKTQDEVERDARLAEAEDDLMREVQNLQEAFFHKHRKWVDVPLNFSSSSSHKTASNGASPGQLVRNKPVSDMSVEDLGSIFDSLALTEHKNMFRRTSGSMLLILTPEQLRSRFGTDLEAADIFEGWLREKTKRDPKPYNVEARGFAPTTAKELLQVDPIALLKQRFGLGMQRPPRPSTEDDHNTSTASTGLEDEDEEVAQEFFRSVAAIHNEVARQPPQQQAAVSAALPPQSSAQHRKAPPTSTHSTKASAPSTSQQEDSKRPNRWQVLDYEEESNGEDE